MLMHALTGHTETPRPAGNRCRPTSHITPSDSVGARAGLPLDLTEPRMLSRSAPAYASGAFSAIVMHRSTGHTV